MKRKKIKIRKANWSNLVDDVVMLKALLHSVTPYDIIEGGTNDVRANIILELMSVLTFTTYRNIPHLNSVNRFAYIMFFQEGIKFFLIPNFNDEKHLIQVLTFLSKLVVYQNQLTQKKLN